MVSAPKLIRISVNTDYISVNGARLSGKATQEYSGKNNPQGEALQQVPSPLVTPATNGIRRIVKNKPEAMRRCFLKPSVYCILMINT